MSFCAYSRDVLFFAFSQNVRTLKQVENFDRLVPISHFVQFGFIHRKVENSQYFFAIITSIDSVIYWDVSGGPVTFFDASTSS